MLWRPWLRDCVCVWLSLLGLIAGCQANHHPPARVIATQPTTRPIVSGKPLLDLSKGAAGFPLLGNVPLNSRENLVAELTGGYAARVALSTTRPAVVAQGKFPNLDSLRIDLSGDTILTSYRPTSLKSVRKIVPVATVKSLSYSACPLRYDDASESLKLTASDVKLAMIRGRGDKAVLVMTDASQGEEQFFVSLADLNAMLRDVVGESAWRAALYVRDSKLTLTSDNPRSLQATVEVRGLWFLVPAAITVTGRLDVDNRFYAKLSHLSCTGTDVAGPLLAGLINSALRKYDQKVMPLAAFPGDKLKIRDLRIRVDDALHIDADFGD